MEFTNTLEQQTKGRKSLANGRRTTSLQDGRTTAVAGRSGIRAQIFFVLGSPGSGKTTVATALKARWKRQGYKVISFNDYRLLLAMTANEQHQGKNLECPAQFCPIMNRTGGLVGFTVIDLVVLEQVLCRINRYICRYLDQPNTIMLVEFARDEYLYERVWQYFSHEVRTTAHYLFCDTSFEVCLERVKQRPQQIDLEVMHSYYSKDGLPSLMQNCNLDRIEVFNTNETMQETHTQIMSFLEKTCTWQFFQTEQVVLREAIRDYRESGLRATLEGEGKSEASFLRLQA